MYTGSTNSASRLAGTVVLLVLYALALLPLVAYGEDESSSKPDMILGLNVAVVAYDPSYSILGNTSQEFFSETLVSLECSVSLNASIRYLYAPSWALGKLQEWMAEHYEDLGVPDWAKDYATKHGLRIKWLRLREFYDFLWNLTSSLLQAEEIKADDIVVVIGDVDGVSRQYYEKPPQYIHAEALEGVKGWAGPRPMAFYDLTVVPRSWPVRTIPFYGSGVHVNITTEPPLWSMSNVPGYVRGLVVDHLRYHYLSFMCVGVKHVEKLDVDVVVVDYGNETVTKTVLDMINTSLLESMLKSMNPWTEYNVTLRVLDADENPELGDIVSSARIENGWMVLSLDAVDESVADNVYSRRISLCSPSKVAMERIVEECTYPVYVLATPKPSFMRLPGSDFNFTGFSTLEYTVLSFPGYGYRILRGGLVRAIAHEIGHFMGLGHPFQLQLDASSPSVETRWLMDYVVSPMSYYDPAIAVYREGDKLYYDQARIALVVTAARLLVAATREAPLIIHGSPQNFLERTGTVTIKTGSTTQAPTEPSLTPIETTRVQVITVYETTTVTLTVPEKEATTKTVTATQTSTVLVTREKETTKTITKTTTYTRTITRIATAEAEKSLEALGLVAVLATGIAIGYLVAAAIRRG